MEWDWSLVYPELAGMLPEAHEKKQKVSSDPLTQQLDKMLADAHISPDLLGRLGQGMENLATNANAIGNMANATTATEKFVSNMDGAANAAGKLLDSMKGAPEAVSTLSNIYRETAASLSGGEVSYADEMKKMAASLASINAMYEMQMQNSTNQIEATKEIQERMQSMMKNFADSAEGVLKYKEQVDALSRKVSELNNVYGNMLAAMQTRI